MNQHKFSFRVGVLVLLIAMMAGIFGVRLYDVQVTQAAAVDRTPSGSHTYRTRVTAARGEILDRNGKVLIGNRASYNLTLIYAVIFSADNPNENLRRLTNLCHELDLEMTDHFPVTMENPTNTRRTSIPPHGTAISRPSCANAAGTPIFPRLSSFAA